MTILTKNGSLVLVGTIPIRADPQLTLFQSPPTQMQPEQHTPKAAYIPEPLVIERNDVFVYALKAAPAVLYERYKQYGQVGEMQSSKVLLMSCPSSVFWPGVRNLVK